MTILFLLPIFLTAFILLVLMRYTSNHKICDFYDCSSHGWSNNKHQHYNIKWFVGSQERRRMLGLRHRNVDHTPAQIHIDYGFYRDHDIFVVENHVNRLLAVSVMSTWNEVSNIDAWPKHHYLGQFHCLRISTQFTMLISHILQNDFKETPDYLFHSFFPLFRRMNNRYFDHKKNWTTFVLRQKEKKKA